MKTKIKICFIGCGSISFKHLKAVKDNSQDIKLVAVCDLNKSRASKLIKNDKVNFYYDYHEMIITENPDIIAILTETGLHAKIFFEISKYKKKIIIEKPLALRANTALKILKDSKKNKNQIFVVKQNRFNAAVIFLKHLIKKKKLGKIFLSTIRLRWRRDLNYFKKALWRGTKKLDGGIICNQTSHHLDIMISIMGEVKELYANGIKALAKKIETEDTVIVNLKFKNGAVGLIEATTATSPVDIEGSISFLGSLGTVILGGYAMNKIDYCKLEKFNFKNKLIYSSKLNGHTQFYYFIIKAIINKKKTSFLEDIHLGKIFEAINESLLKNKVVKL